MSVITLKFSDPSLENNLGQDPDEREKTVLLMRKLKKFKVNEVKNLY